MKKFVGLSLSLMLVVSATLISENAFAAQKKVNKTPKETMTFRNMEPQECNDLRTRIMNGSDACPRAKGDKKEKECKTCLDGASAISEAQYKGCDLNSVQGQIADIRENLKYCSKTSKFAPIMESEQGN